MKREIKLEIDSRLENIPLVGMAVNKICSSLNLSKIKAYEMELCVVEACTNVIKHAYENKPGNKLKVAISIDDEKIVFKICDTGKSMDAEKLCPKEPNPYDLAESGRGLIIMNKLMDKLDYKTENGKNILIMTKQLR
jgi:serine/threonine-protein kinase RsbW